MATAVVIGSASGIGKGLVSALKQKGISVFEGDRSITHTTQTENSFYIDATNKESITSFVTNVSTKTDQIDYLLITIGAIDTGCLDEYPDGNLSWMLEVNLLAPYRLVQAFIPILQKSAHPKILLTGSAAGLGFVDYSGNLGPYTISKHALTGYAKVLMAELSEKGIQVSLLIPNRITGNLAANSAQMRMEILSEPLDNKKGTQPPGTLLADATALSTTFLEDFLQGKRYISNNIEMVLEKLRAEIDNFE